MKRFLNKIQKRYPKAKFVQGSDPYIQDDCIELDEVSGIQLFEGIYVPYVEGVGIPWTGEEHFTPEDALLELSSYLNN